MKTILKRATSLLLSLLMVFSVCSTALVVYAEDNQGESNESKTIKYVSLGDSMTNGYGFNGYNQDKHTVSEDDHIDPSEYNYFDGTGVYGKGSYALQFEEYLKGIYGEENVEHTKLATSAFRPEDLYLLLGLGDSDPKNDAQWPLKDGYFNNVWAYFWNRCDERTNDHINGVIENVFVPGTSCGIAGYVSWYIDACLDPTFTAGNEIYAYEAQFEYLRKYFTNALLDADVISLALGNAAFDAYFMDRLFKIWGAMGAGDFDHGEDYGSTYQYIIHEMELEDIYNLGDKEIVDALYEAMQAIMASYVSEEEYSELEMERVCRLLTYITFSYMYSYKAVIEWIGDNNPDAEIMLVGLLNSHNGITLTSGGEEFADMGETMGALYNIMNTYIAGVAADYMAKNKDKEENPFTGKFYFVEQPENPEMIATMIDELDKAGWTLVDCGNSDCEYCLNGEACPNGRLDGSIVRYKTIPVYNRVFSGGAGLGYWWCVEDGDVAGQLALIKRAIDANLHVQTVATMSGQDADDINVLGTIAATAMYLACEKAMVKALESGDLQIEALVQYASASMVELLADAPRDNLPTNKPGKAPWADVAVPEGAYLGDIYREYYEYFTSEKMLPMIQFFAINKVGNGIAAHPTPSNHDQTAANMIAAYENGYTVQDKCKAESDIIMVNDVYYTLSSTGLLGQDQTDAIIDFFVDVMLGEKDSSTAYAFIYETLLSNEDDAKNIEVITTVYSILGEYGYLDPYADKTALIEAVLAIPAMAKVSDANFMNIVDCIFAAVTSGNEINAIEIAKSVYEIIFRNEPALDDVDKINIILGVYSLIKVDYLGDYEKELAVIEEIGANEKFKDIVTAQHAFAVVDKVYEVIKDGDLSNEDIRIIANFVYFEVFGNVQKKARGGVFALTDYPVISAIDKLTIIEVVYDALGNYVPEETIPAFAAVKELYTAVKNADEITDEKLIEVIDVVVGTYVENEVIGSEEIAAATTQIADAILSDSTISAETKLALTNKVTETLKELGGAIGGGSTPIIPSIPVPDMTIVTKIFDRLVKEEKLLTDAEANQIINDIYPILLSGTIDKDAIAGIVTSIYTVVFADDDLDLKQKTRVVTVVIEVVCEEYDIQGAYEYALKYATEMGYIDIAIDALDKAYAEAKQYAIEALAKVEICPEIKTELVAELANLDSLYEDAKAFVLANAGKLDLTIAEDSVAELNKKQLELYAALDDLDAAFKGILENGLEASFDAIEAAIDGVAAEVVEIVAVVSPEGAVYVEQFMAEAKLFVEEVLYNTTHADYTVNKDSYYVALGNGEYVGSFIEKIAEKVKSEGVSYKFDEKDYKDLTSDAGIAALTEIIAANVADIAKADLISLGYTFDTAAENTMRIAIELIFKGETDLPTEFDWVELVGAEAAAEVEKVLATLRAELVAQGLDKTIDEIADVNLGKDITLADAAMAAVEYFAYNAVEYAVVMPQAVYAINKINPDAVIMINAMSNPIAGAKISLFGTELAFGDYINYVTDALYLETAAIAAVNKNVVFVPATEVKTTLTDKVITFNTDDLIELAKELGALITDLELNELIYATEEGNAYIAEQMFAALNITVEHSALLGDVNADGKINLLDAVGVVEYYIGNTVLVDVVAADVTGDGIVDLRDAVCIIEFYIGNINEFPAA